MLRIGHFGQCKDMCTAVRFEQIFRYLRIPVFLRKLPTRVKETT
jgi:hypothetical protein